VDLTRSIRAITLLGKGFGEIIKPSKDANSLCQNWKHVPTGKDYLVARTSTLKEICKRHGNHSSNPMELANEIYWHKPDKLFEPCECKSASCDRVQVLLPASLGSKRHPQPFGYDNGAVIFGRSRRFPWHWPSEGDPIEGGSSDQEGDNESEFHDSGVGSSLSRTASSLANLGSPSRLSGGSDVLDVSTGGSPNLEQKDHSATVSERDMLGHTRDGGPIKEARFGQLATKTAPLDEICQEHASAGSSTSRTPSEPTKGVAMALRSRQPQMLSSAKRALDKLKGFEIIPQKRRKGKDLDIG
jgi:hypothetical protein